MPDKCFDLAVVDPVYGDITAGGYLTGKSRGGVGPHPHHGMQLWSQEKTGKDFFDELFRVSANQIIFGGNYFAAEIARDSQCWIVWDKCHPEGIKFADAELAWTSFNSKTRIFRFLWNGMCQGTPGDGTKMQGDKTKNEKRIHPTQKPVALYTWIFQNYARPGDRILDTQRTWSSATGGRFHPGRKGGRRWHRQERGRRKERAEYGGKERESAESSR